MAKLHREKPVNQDARRLIDGEMEALIIGNILQSGESAYREVAFLTADDFGVERHNKRVFQTIIELASEVDPTVDAVAEQLTSEGKIDAVGGLAGLLDIHAKGGPWPAFGRLCPLASRKTLRPPRVSVM